jgi:hypothetical protein
MAKVSIEDIRNQCNFLEYCFINAASKLSAREFAALVESQTDGKFDIKLMVNGFELPLMETFKEIEKQKQRMIYEEAQDQVEEKFAHLENIFLETIDDLREKLEL